MANPLIEVNPRARLLLGVAGEARASPALRALMMRVITECSALDLVVINTVARMMKADCVVVAEMFSVVSSGAARRDMIYKAAESVLSPADFEVFARVMRAVNTARKHRHPYAHWIIAVAPAIEDAVVLVSPSYLARFEAEGESAHRTNDDSVLVTGMPTAEEALVYRKADIISDIRLVRKTRTLVFSFGLTLDVEEYAREIGRRQLSRMLPPKQNTQTPTQQTPPPPLS